MAANKSMNLISFPPFLQQSFMVALMFIFSAICGVAGKK
jgi:hypothetical protein